MYDSIVIGAGIAGAVAGRELAERGGHKVLIIEKRNHVGGNCYDELDANGVLIHTYGPHIFHTGNERVRTYLSRFTSWRDFEHKVVANVHGALIPVPFNLNTLHRIYDEKTAAYLEELLVESFGEGSRVSVLDLRRCQNEDIKRIADYVYENIFLYYTMKQWGQTPEEISPEVTGRVPVVISRDNRYFQDIYQGVPKEGFTSMFLNMLDHENIEVRLGTDAKALLHMKDGIVYFAGQKFAGNVIYTGPPDELFGCCFGRLPYRSLDFSFEHYTFDDFQGHGVVNYTVSEAYTRITEFKHLTGQRCPGTTIVKEYPCAYTAAEGQIPYYAIMNEENNALYEKYREQASEYKNFYLLGRLAEYRYYNMDVMAEKALELADQILLNQKEG